MEVEIDTMDRGGNFLGTLTVPGGSRPFNLGPALLEAGLAKLHPSFDPDRVQGGAELAAAQERAQKAKLKVCPIVWSDCPSIGARSHTCLIHVVQG